MVGLQLGDSVEVGDAAWDEPVCGGFLQHVAHMLEPAAQGWHHGLQRRCCPDTVDLLLAVAGQVERASRRAFVGAPPVVVTTPPGLFRSTMSTVRPKVAASSAATSPAGPATITTKS
jgi:hypothetical protein